MAYATCCAPRTRKTRQTFRGIGDKSYYAAPVLPLLVDAFVVSLLVRGDKRSLTLAPDPQCAGPCLALRGSF